MLEKFYFSFDNQWSSHNKAIHIFMLLEMKVWSGVRSLDRHLTLTRMLLFSSLFKRTIHMHTQQ